MSWEHVELVRRQHQPSTAKLLLYVIALRANAEGICWPSVNTLAQDSGLARRTVQAQLAYLEGQDLLRREATPGRANGLRLNVRKLRAGAGLAEVHDEAATGATNASQPSTSCVPPAQNRHPAARQVHPSCAPAAPEVKREELFNKVRQ